MPVEVFIVLVKPAAVKTEFVAAANSSGLERLALSAQQAGQLAEFGLARLERLHPQLETQVGDKTKVLKDAEYRRQAKLPARGPETARAFESADRYFALKFKEMRPGIEFCERLKRIAVVEQCQPSLPPKTLAFVPNDPMFAQQWGFNNTAPGGPNQVAGFDIDAPEAWDTQKGRPDVVVGVLDTAIDITHPDLYRNVFINENELPTALVQAIKARAGRSQGPVLMEDFDASVSGVSAILNQFTITDLNGNGYIDGVDLLRKFSDGRDGDPMATQGRVDDIVGFNFKALMNDPTVDTSPGPSHGTASAGLIAALANNGRDVSGTAPRIRILPLVLGTGQASAALDYASRMGATMVESSTDGSNSDPLTFPFLQDLENIGMSFVVSLGNGDGMANGTVFSNQPSSISVANFESRGKRAGRASILSVRTDVAAPGQGMPSLDRQGGTQIFSGTSASAPVAAGVAALIAAERKDRGLKPFTPEQMRQALRASATDIPAVNDDEGTNKPGFDYASGFGLVNARRALEFARRNDILAGKVMTRIPMMAEPANRPNDVHHFRRETEIPLLLTAGNPDLRHLGLTRPMLKVTVRVAKGHPPIERSQARVLFTGGLNYVVNSNRVSGGLINVRRDQMECGLNTVEVAVGPPVGAVAGAFEAVDYLRFDLPCALMDIGDNQVLERDLAEIKGAAFLPASGQFGSYVLFAAQGHNVAANAVGAWRQVGVSVAQEQPPFKISGLINHTYNTLFTNVRISQIPFSGKVSLKLTVFDQSRRPVHDHVVPVFVKKGAQVPMAERHRFGGTVAYDLNGDQVPEILVGAQDKIHAFHVDGRTVQGWPATLPAGQNVAVSIAVGDVNGDTVPEVVVRGTDTATKDDTLHVFKATGGTLWQKPTQTNYFFDFARSGASAEPDVPPVLADLNNDGKLEILLAGTSNLPNEGAVVRIFRGDGTQVTTLASPTTRAFTVPPAVGDLDRDGVLEVVTASSEEQYGLPSKSWISIFNGETYARTGPFELFHDVSSAEISGTQFVTGLVLADFDGDGQGEIGALNRQMISTIRRKTDGARQSLRYFPKPFQEYPSTTNLSVGDVDGGNGSVPEMVINYSLQPSGETYYQNVIFVQSASAGPLPQFGRRDLLPRKRSVAQPVVFDFNGDGRKEILAPAFHLYPDLEQTLHAVDSTGGLLSDIHLPMVILGGLPRGLVAFERPVTSLLRQSRTPVLAYAGVNVDPYNPRMPNFETLFLSKATRPGSFDWAMQFHSPQRTSDYHGGLRLVAPTSSGPAKIRLTRSPMVKVRLINDLPHGSFDRNSPVEMRLNGRVPLTIRGVRRAAHGFEFDVQLPPNLQTGAYDLHVLWKDGSIERRAIQRGAVSIY